ncbi:MAG: ATP-binding cassette domain-containing protein [Actinobacteria bacterium]|nr:ATP-binding cassette domain-containing protein [Actinomycetota bacterium]
MPKTSGNAKQRLVLTARGLVKKYGDAVALGGLDLDLRSGECVALIGHNGSGKTTAMRIMAGLMEPSEGSVKIKGIDIHVARGNPITRSAIAFAPDNPVLYDDLTVEEHLILTGLAHGVGDGLDERIDIVLEELGLTDRRDYLPSQLSRGMRQKTSIACTLVRPLEVLMLDEPVVGLDPPSQRLLRDEISRLISDEVAVILTTHQIEFARGIAAKAVILDNGEMVDHGAFDQVVEGEKAASLGLV